MWAKQEFTKDISRGNYYLRGYVTHFQIFPMTEEFIHYLWKYRLLDPDNLITKQGEKLEIINPGLHNFDSGPDFFNAKLKIGKTTWAGNVEMHINSSDWNKHGHETDKAYENVILHVVYNYDEEIKPLPPEIQMMPTVEIKDKFKQQLFHNFKMLKESVDWIPCQSQLQGVLASGMLLSNYFERLTVERLERKSDQVMKNLMTNFNNWEESFYQQLARNFGFKTNALPFELLARSLPLAIVRKYSGRLISIEAMFFGQAGFLNGKFTDDYPQLLQKEYQFIQHKFGLNPIDKHLWKFMRLRPYNFPTIRIAQFAGLLNSNPSLFSLLATNKNLSEARNILASAASPYWNTHFNFDKSSANKEKILGETGINNLMINTVVPFIFVYGKWKGNELLQSRALDLLMEIPGETNSIILKWKVLGLPVKTAFDTQSLLQLKNEYCNQKKCLSCNIGLQILKGTGSRHKVSG